MQLFVDRGESLAQWAEDKYFPTSEKIGTSDSGPTSLKIALVNNMPDAAVEDTEAQFCRLLSRAMHGVQVRVRLYTLPRVPRAENLQRYLRNNYADFSDLFNHRFDGVIITGTEPRQTDLKKEPYWSELADLLNWAEENTTSTILSCLAAHASVLHGDGIIRTPLPHKRFGVFAYEKLGEHLLTRGTPDAVRFPHSRWNDLRERDLKSAGYTVLTRSSEFGVDSFVKQKNRSLFLHFQGHPEYEAQTLFKEYRRDVRRYLRGERDNYPSLPHDYFGQAERDLLNNFQTTAIAGRSEATMELFPSEGCFAALQNGWHESANQIYGNWLGYLSLRKKEQFTRSLRVTA